MSDHRDAAAHEASAPSNIMTVDVEDWFHILEVDGGYQRADWGTLESRVEHNTAGLLALFDRFDTKATFFIVGWVAWKYPQLVRAIADAGHEIGSHSFWHEVIPRHDRSTLAADLGSSRRLLEDLSGTPVRGFRAPGGSITPEGAWAFDVMLEQGYEYDSSLCPGISSHGGYPSPHFGPHMIQCDGGVLAEIPSSTFSLGARRVPYAGGGYLRLFPSALIDRCIRGDNAAGRPSNVYVHPREIDPGQPRMALPAMRRFKYYVGLRSTEAKLEAMLSNHRFTSAARWLEAHRDEIAGSVLDVRGHASKGGPSPDPALLPPAPPPDDELATVSARQTA
jgi:polysaccharide deacetylase family protein (PEP-CTERM system associated)